MKYKLKLEHALYFLGVVALVAIIGLFIYPKLKAAGDANSTVISCDSDAHCIIGGSIINHIPYETTRSELLSYLVKDNIKQTIYFEGHDPVQKGDIVRASSENLTKTQDYILSDLLPASKVCSITSGVDYVVVDAAGKTLKVNYNITPDQLIAGLVLGEPHITFDTSKLTLPYVKKGDSLKITAQDPTVSVTYNISEIIPIAPIVTTLAATEITKTGATLNANVTSDGGDSMKIQRFEYGTTDAYGTITLNYGGTLGAGAYSQNITDLKCDTEYHFRADAQGNTTELVYGADQTFTTDHCPSAPSGGYSTTGGKIVSPVAPATVTPAPASPIYVDECPPRCVVTPNSPKDIIKNLQTVLNNFITKYSTDWKVADSDGKVITSDSKVIGSNGKLIALDWKVADANGKLIALDWKVAGSDGQLTSPDSKVVSPSGKLIALDWKRVDSNGKLIALDWKVVGPDGKVITPDSKVVDANGKLIALDWKVANSNGKLISPDWKTVDPNGKLIALDWKMVDANGKLIALDWKVVGPDGKVITPDSKVVDANGKLIPLDWKVASPDGKLIALDWKRVDSNGKLIALDWKVVGPDGKVITPDSKVVDANGKLIALDWKVANSNGKLISPDWLVADGILGPLTKNTIANFQKISGLKPDGIVGAKTLNALKTSGYATNGTDEQAENVTNPLTH